ARYLLVVQRGDGGLVLDESVLLRGLRDGPLVTADDVPFAFDGPCEYFRSAEIHSDRMARLHSGYRNPPHGRLRGEAVSRLSRRPDEGQGAAAAAGTGGTEGRSQRRPRPRQDRRAAPAPPPPPARLDVAPLAARP